MTDRELLELAAKAARRDIEIERLQDVWETSREAHKQLRILLQTENEQLKARLAHSGVELQRAVAKERNQTAPVAPVTTTASRYIAGMLAAFLKWPDDDHRIEVFAGIIERRIRAFGMIKKQVPLTCTQIDDIWGNLTPEGFGKSRYTIIREIEAAHGITEKP